MNIYLISSLIQNDIRQNIIFLYVHKNCIKKCIIEPFIIFMYKPGSLKKFISVNKLLFAKALSSFSCFYIFIFLSISLAHLLGWFLVLFMFVGFMGYVAGLMEFWVVLRNILEILEEFFWMI